MRSVFSLTLVFGMMASQSIALDLKPVHPGEPVEITLNNRFSMESALSSLNKVEEFLRSFRNLTKAARKKIPAKQLEEIGNTDLEMQTIGFPNIPGAIKGTLLKQDYQIKKLSYELALEQSKTDQHGSDKLAAAKMDYLKAEETFQKFWNSFGIAD